MIHIAALTISLLAALAQTAGPTSQSQPDPLGREIFDRLDQQLNHGDGYKTGLGGDIAWGESYVMIAYVDMYRATKDTRYLDKLVDHAEHVLANRDDKRGFKDYSGRSRPAWSVGERYTVAELVLKDAQNRNLLEFRSTPYAFNDETLVRVTTRPADDHFDMTITNAQWKKQEEYKSLSCDPTSTDFVEQRVNLCGNVAIDRGLACSEGAGSNLVTVKAVREEHSSRVPSRDAAGLPLDVRDVKMTPLFMAYHGYSGQATFGMLDFAYLVQNNPALREKYGSIAARFTDECVRVFVDAESEWRDGPEAGEGYYVMGERACPFWCDNIGKPHNYLASEGRSLVRLSQVSGDRRWRQRAEGIARLIKHHLRPTDQGGYVWNYWWGLPESGWTRDVSPSYNTPTWTGTQTIEDTSHGHLDVDFICLAAHAGIIFQDSDMRRFVDTLLGTVVDETKWTLNDRVDGKSGWGQHNATVGGWVELAAWDRRVLAAARQVCVTNRLHESANGANMMTLARLIRWSHAVSQ